MTLLRCYKKRLLEMETEAEIQTPGCSSCTEKWVLCTRDTSKTGSDIPSKVQKIAIFQCWGIGKTGWLGIQPLTKGCGREGRGVSPLRHDAQIKLLFAVHIYLFLLLKE